MSEHSNISGDNIFIHTYHTRKSGLEDDITHFIWDLKNGQNDAKARASEVLSSKIKQQDQRFLALHSTWYFVVIPGSQIGFGRTHYETLGAELARDLGWVHILPRVLRRKEAIPSSHRAQVGERVLESQHANTIEYTGPLLSKNIGIILFDDIYTTGATSRACRTILEQNAHCGHIIGVFMGRTTWG